MKLLTAIIAMIVIASSAHAADEIKRITLNESIRLAVENNLEVRAELYNPAQFEADINRNKSIYDIQLGLQSSYGDDASQWSSAGDILNFDLSSSLSRLFWTGATAAVSFNNNFTNSNSLDNWRSRLGGTLTQPLLKNMGREATEINISVSRLSKFASIEKFKSRLLNTIAQVKNEYFKLYNVREQLEVKKVSLELSRKILNETKARVAAGVLPAMEILNAEFGVVSREKEVIDAEKAVNDQVDVLRLLLQIQERRDISTVDIPRRELIEVSEEEAIRRALSRPDIRELKRNLEITELQTRVFSNKILPDLSLSASAGLTGNDRTYKRDLEKVGSFENPVWSIGLNFSYPLGNNAAENDYRKSRLKSAQIALQIRSLEEGAANDVKSAIRGIAAGYKQIDVADRGRIFAEERLRAFIRKNEVGLATTKDVLDVENDLATAKNSQIAAAVNYDNAVTRLWQLTGELLEREGVRMVEGDADKLYKNIH